MEGQTLIGWRDVPIDLAHCGATARDVLPVFRQIYIRMRRVPPSAWERAIAESEAAELASIGEATTAPEASEGAATE